MRVFIDGRAGTTGLQLEERLSAIPEVVLFGPERELRKDLNTRKEYLNCADVVFLCLPDAAAREAVELVENPDTVVIDASTAHRTAEGWVYGFPELSAEHREAVKTSNRIAVPGCHASGFCAIVNPIVKAGIIDKTETVFCTSLTGYSGGGKQMIADYESGGGSPAKVYGLSLSHKHLPEMTHLCGLLNPPVFQPIIVNTLKGMITSVPICRGVEEVWEALREHYAGAENVSVMPLGGDTLDIAPASGTDGMEIYVFGNRTQTVAAARFDNLGKGSAGAAVQCMKLRMGL